MQLVTQTMTWSSDLGSRAAWTKLIPPQQPPGLVSDFGHFLGTYSALYFGIV